MITIMLKGIEGSKYPDLSSWLSKGQCRTGQWNWPETSDQFSFVFRTVFGLRWNRTRQANWTELTRFSWLLELFTQTWFWMCTCSSYYCQPSDIGSMSEVSLRMCNFNLSWCKNCEPIICENPKVQRCNFPLDFKFFTKSQGAWRDWP